MQHTIGQIVINTIKRNKADKGRGGKIVVKEGGQTLGGEHTMQHTDAALRNCTPKKTYIMLLTIVTPTQLIKKKIIYVNSIYIYK